MAGTPTTMTTADAILKDFYSGPMESIINQSHPLYDATAKGTESYLGRQVKFPVQLRRPMNVGSRSSYVPEANATTVEDASVSAKKHYARIQLSGEVIAAATGNNTGAFLSAVEMETKANAEALADDLNRQCYGFVNSVNNNTGVLTQVNGTVGAATTVTCDSNRYLYPGTRIWIGTAAEITGGTADKVTVLTQSTNGTDITIASTTVADNDLIVRGDSLESAYTAEIAGLNFAISTADDNFQGIDTGDYPEWKGIVNSNSGVARNLDLRLMNLVIDDLYDSSGKRPDFLIMHSSIRREYVDLLTPDVRYQPQKLEGGYETLTFASNGTPMKVHDDKHATYGNIYFLNMSTIKRYELQPFKWQDRTGAIWRPVADKDDWEAIYLGYNNLGYRQRNALAVLKDIDYSLTA